MSKEVYTMVTGILFIIVMIFLISLGIRRYKEIQNYPSIEFNPEPMSGVVMDQDSLTSVIFENATTLEGKNLFGSFDDLKSVDSLNTSGPFNYAMTIRTKSNFYSVIADFTDSVIVFTDSANNRIDTIDIRDKQLPINLDEERRPKPEYDFQMEYDSTLQEWRRVDTRIPFPKVKY